MLTDTYHRLVPLKVRTPLWQLRSYVAHRTELIGRHHLADFLLSIGHAKATVRLDDGRKFSVDLRDDGVGRPLYVRREYEPAETHFVTRCLGSGMTFVDVGANIGYYTVLAARRVGPAGRVVAIEPDLLNSNLLRMNVRQNRVERWCDLHRIAAGREPGTVNLWRSRSNFGDHRITGFRQDSDSVEVEVDTLDRRLATLGRRIDLMKIDVQGYEADVFAGMKTMLSNEPPTLVLMEYWPGGIRSAGHDPTEMLRYLEECGYTFALLDELGRTSPVRRDEVDAMVPPVDPQHPDWAYVNLILSQRDGRLG